MTKDEHLIAAAPHMLKALKAIRKWLLFNEPIRDPEMWNGAFVKANNLANKAIAKAEGREPAHTSAQCREVE